MFYRIWKRPLAAAQVETVSQRGLGRQKKGASTAQTTASLAGVNLQWGHLVFKVGFIVEVKKVMIASPSDVSEERGVIRDVIYEWNAVHAEDRHVVLMPVGWETHASPAMGDRPQAIINKQLSQQVDLLVAVFWTRLGSPTGTTDSGTVEEIEEHLATEKPAMIYFSSAPVRPDSVDNDQYSALKTFKESCKQKGLIEEYAHIDEFRAKFSRQLAQTVIRSFISAAGVTDVGEIAASEPVPSLSEAARELLLAAAQDRNGMIMSLPSMGGRIIQTNGRGFVESRNPRSEARWKGAIDELHRFNLIEDRGHKREAFAITADGYRVADHLRLP